MKVLDAGAGQGRRAFPGCEVVALDLDEAALSRNPAQERIVGDLENYPLEREAFDFVYCHDVLEHLDDPAAALRNMAACLRPGGRVELHFPKILCLKSLVAKFTPLWFHVLVYRTVFRDRLAGQPGHGPYPTRLRFVLRESRFRQLAARAGLEVESWRVVRTAFEGRPVLSVLCGGRECEVVLRKP